MGMSPQCIRVHRACTHRRRRSSQPTRLACRRWQAGKQTGHCFKLQLLTSVPEGAQVAGAQRLLCEQSKVQQQGLDPPSRLPVYRWLVLPCSELQSGWLIVTPTNACSSGGHSLQPPGPGCANFCTCVQSKPNQTNQLPLHQPTLVIPVLNPPRKRLLQPLQWRQLRTRLLRACSSIRSGKRRPGRSGMQHCGHGRISVMHSLPDRPHASRHAGNCRGAQRSS